MQEVLKQFYRKAAGDGCVQVQEIVQACSICGMSIDPNSASNLLVKLAGPDRRLTEHEFAAGLARFAEDNLGPQLRSFFQRACSDGMLQLAEIQQVLGMFGISIDLPTAQQVLVRIAGRDQRVTEREFVRGVLDFVAERKFAMMTMSTMPNMSPMSMPNQLPTMYGQPMMGSGLTPAQMQLKMFFGQACADGMLQVGEVQQACAMCGLQVDPVTAQQLIVQIAGADQRITEMEFVNGILRFVQTQQQQRMMMGGNPMMGGMGGGNPMMGGNQMMGGNPMMGGGMPQMQINMSPMMPM
ncbi:hypothetical protein PAPYR_10550 [Paratrimastix pyriformis]|uniref:Uncharacterized protein n=1 Tax=Paratrimastix pyriformis TaxID=342808 RepID=A0ABQ8U5P8_9EUKA|nr:hypothetical protein PAPYR_10550 [Paratrimastix pyriformis]